MNNDKYKLIRPPKEIFEKVDKYIYDNRLGEHKKEIDYHFNRGEWTVDLADTKRVMINYDFRDLVTDFHAFCEKDDGETNQDFRKRERIETDNLRNGLLKLYYDFRQYVFEQLKPIAEKMDYDDLFDLFYATWKNAPFKLNYLLEDTFLLLSDQSIMQNVVGDSGAFKSTRSMIEFNTLPSVLRFDDTTVAGLTREARIKGKKYLNNTVVYYNDVGDSAQMQANFRECLQSVYKKLYSEGAVSRNIAMKSSDNTLRLNLETPDGFKLKFNSVKPIFNEDDGQTAARTMIINLPSQSKEESIELVRSGRFGLSTPSTMDPRIFKDVLQAYYKTRSTKIFDDEFNAQLCERAAEDNNDKPNYHKYAATMHQHREMFKLYGVKYYRDKYFNRVMINTSVKDLEKELYEIIQKGLDIEPMPRERIYTVNNLNDFCIAHTSSASIHKSKNNYDSFTIKAVQGIRRKFIQKNSTRISELLRSMEEHDLVAKIGTTKERYNIYVLLD